MGQMSQKTLAKLQRKFESWDLLDAVDELDKIRYLTADVEEFFQPQVRLDLMKLHDMTFKLINHGDTSWSEDEDFWELAFEIEDTVRPIYEGAKKLLSIIHWLTSLAPDPFEEEDDIEKDQRKKQSQGE